MQTLVPHYLRLKQFILYNISTGRWPVQGRIPSENELVKQFRVSRMTVNRAMRALADEGVLDRIQGVGTFVAGPKAESAMFEVRNIREDIHARGETHTVEILINELVDARPTITLHFGLPAGSPLFHSRLLHNANGKPVQMEDRFINPSLAPGYLEVDFSMETPHQYLMRVAPLERAEHIIEAETASKRLSAKLQVNAGAPLLVLTRRTWSRQQMVSYVRLIHPASRHRFIGTFAVGTPTNL